MTASIELSRLLGRQITAIQAEGEANERGGLFSLYLPLSLPLSSHSLPLSLPPSLLSLSSPSLSPISFPLSPPRVPMPLV